MMNGEDRASWDDEPGHHRSGAGVDQCATLTQMRSLACPSITSSLPFTLFQTKLNLLETPEPYDSAIHNYNTLAQLAGNSWLDIHVRHGHPAAAGEYPRLSDCRSASREHLPATAGHEAVFRAYLFRTQELRITIWLRSKTERGWSDGWMHQKPFPFRCVQRLYTDKELIHLNRGVSIILRCPVMASHQSISDIDRSPVNDIAQTLLAFTSMKKLFISILNSAHHDRELLVEYLARPFNDRGLPNHCSVLPELEARTLSNGATNNDNGGDDHDNDDDE